MSQKQNLSEFQQTINELKKMGGFTDEEYNFLEGLNLSIDELSQELGEDRFVIQYKNNSTNPDPVIFKNTIVLKASKDIALIPNSSLIIPTNIELELPDNIIIRVTTPTNLIESKIFTLEHYLQDNNICIVGINHSDRKIIKAGEDIAKLILVYTFGEEAVVLKPKQSS